MQKYIYYYSTSLKNILITVFQHDWFPLRSSAFFFFFNALKMLVRLQRKEEGWEAGTIAKKKKKAVQILFLGCAIHSQEEFRVSFQGKV